MWKKRHPETPENVRESGGVREKFLNAGRRIGHTTKRIARDMDQSSTTWIPSFWWICLWVSYIGNAGVYPAFYKSQQISPGLGLLLTLLFMVVTFFLERLDDWVSIMFMNSMISIAVVPGCFMLNVYREMTGQYATWSFAGRLGFFAVQVGALVLVYSHLSYTKQRWKAFPPRDKRPKRTLPLKPSLEGPVQLGALFLLAIFSLGMLMVLVKIKNIFPAISFPVYYLIFFLLLFFLIVGGIICFLIHKALQNR